MFHVQLPARLLTIKVCKLCVRQKCDLKGIEFVVSLLERWHSHVANCKLGIVHMSKTEALCPFELSLKRGMPPRMRLAVRTFQDERIAVLQLLHD